MRRLMNKKVGLIGNGKLIFRRKMSKLTDTLSRKYHQTNKLR